eukprot:COSAG05_NODE_3850_length_1808_cov_1.038619_3_plen_51_part_01
MARNLGDLGDLGDLGKMRICVPNAALADLAWIARLSLQDSASKNESAAYNP